MHICQRLHVCGGLADRAVGHAEAAAAPEQEEICPVMDYVAARAVAAENVWCRVLKRGRSTRVEESRRTRTVLEKQRQRGT